MLSKGQHLAAPFCKQSILDTEDFKKLHKFTQRISRCRNRLLRFIFLALFVWVGNPMSQKVMMMERSQQSQLFSLFLSPHLPFGRWGSSPLFTPPLIPWLRCCRKQSSREAPAEGMNEWSRMAQEPSLPKLPLFQYIHLLRDTHSHSETSWSLCEMPLR